MTLTNQFGNLNHRQYNCYCHWLDVSRRRGRGNTVTRLALWKSEQGNSREYEELTGEERFDTALD